MCARLMLRKLLACLALLTGLAAAGAPLQAEVATAMASRVEAGPTESAAPRGQAPAASARRAGSSKMSSTAAKRPLLRTVVRVPVIELQSDRARE